MKSLKIPLWRGVSWKDGVCGVIADDDPLILSLSKDAFLAFSSLNDI
jgi:hypothetical protein